MPALKDKLFSLEYFRDRLGHLDAIPQYALLGILSGAVTGLVILAFRLAIEIPLHFWLPGDDPDNFEALAPWARFITPVIGTLLIAFFISSLRKESQKVGVTLVLERLNFHRGHMRLGNLGTQFVVGVLSLVSGQSAGREGPAIHLGAACSSYLGRRYQLPNNSIRVLIGCGTAAAISASFNTPIAGVIFAMEVVMMEYTIAGFTPVILSSVTAAVITRMVYGADAAFEVPALSINSLLDIPFTVMMGVVIGTLAALFIKTAKYFTRFQHYHFTPRALVAGLLTGCIAFFVPSVMGIGYDSIHQALLGNLGLGVLCALTIGKLLATAIPIGLGMPYGLIGPVIVLGASAGGALGLAGDLLLPEHSSDVGIYAMLGMGAMMGAVLQAPLAALMALLELTGNSNIILPGMLIIVVANLTARVVFKQKSIFNTMLEAQGVYLRDAPALQPLCGTGVVKLINNNFVSLDRNASFEQASTLLETNPTWVLLKERNKPVYLLSATDLKTYLAKHEAENNNGEENQKIDLIEAPVQGMEIRAIHCRATVQEALDALHKKQVEALCVVQITAPMSISAMGIITRQDIENYYLQ